MAATTAFCMFLQALARLSISGEIEREFLVYGSEGDSGLRLVLSCSGSSSQWCFPVVVQKWILKGFRGDVILEHQEPEHSAVLEINA